MSFFKDLFSVAAPMVGAYFGGPMGAALGGAIGGGMQGGWQGAALGGLGGYGAAGGTLGGLFQSGGQGGVPPNPFYDGPVGVPANPFYQGGGGSSSFLQNLFGSGGSGGNWGGMGGQGGGGQIDMARLGQSMSQIMAGLEGRRKAKELQRMMQLSDPRAMPTPGDITSVPGYQAGLEAVQRSLAAQGYQGSGNMMAALHKYGGDAYNQYVNQRLAANQQQLASAIAQAGPVSGGLSSFALLSHGMGGLLR